MTEALLTALGLILGVVATVVSLIHDETASTTRRLLMGLAAAGLCGGLYTTYVQYDDRNKADDQAKEAKEQLTELQKKVGDLQQVDASVESKTADLTLLNKLGGGQYYVTLATFQKNSAKDDASFEKTRHQLLLLYPDAETNHLLWTSPVGKNQSAYELRFGRHLTPSSAQIFWGLANHGLANGTPIIHREK